MEPQKQVREGTRSMAAGLDPYADGQAPQIERGNSAGVPISAAARQICINPLNHGFHITVGCQAFACETIDALLHRLNVYLKSPAETERRWMSGELKF